jgi:hypothetical protein
MLQYGKPISIATLAARSQFIPTYRAFLQGLTGVVVAKPGHGMRRLRKVNRLVHQRGWHMRWARVCSRPMPDVLGESSFSGLNLSAENL